ncbi:MAG: hypothetical protein ACK4FF_13320 [Limnobacter sp.]|uniref:hypothetical protein n=1 Tax=Limnobacter sp. TaxID=2003368 RepID=UPI00391A4FD6
MVIEPHWVTPAFSGQGLLELALNGVHSDALTTGLSPSQGAAVESMDHFRVLCLMYFGVPLALYLGTHLKSL